MRAQPTQKRIKVDDEAKLVELEPTAFSARSVKPNHPSAVVIMNKFEKQAVKQPQSSRTASG